MDLHLLHLTADIVAAHVSNNEASTDDLLHLIRSVHKTLSAVGHPVTAPSKTQPAVHAKKSIFPDHIVCLDCGHGFKMLKRHLSADHDLSPNQYRSKWGLPSSYPMVAPEYAEQRSQLAKDSGLGRRPTDEPETGHKKRGRPAKEK